MSDAFDVPQKAINWAVECLGKAWDDFVVYLQNGGFAFVTEKEAETGDEVRKFRQEKPIPDSVEGYLRNALVDIKHSFDQSLFAAVSTVRKVPYKGNYPWADTPNGVTGILTKRQEKENTWLPQILIDEIWRQQPYATGATYAGGNDLIREIANVVNDKHTVGFRAAAAITQSMIPVVFSKAPMKGSVSFFERWNPVKKEMVISRKSGEGGSISNYNPQVKVDVFLEATGEIGAISVHIVVNSFAQRAQLVLEGFKRVCAEAPAAEIEPAHSVGPPDWVRKV